MLQKWEQIGEKISGYNAVLLFVVSVMNFLLHVIGDDKEKQTKQLAR
jgi:hypothetical protein